MRRLPVYLLLDVSGSMRGEPIAAVNEGVTTLIETLRMNPYALETAYISIITFNNDVQQVVPLTELYKIQSYVFDAKLGTYLGKALKFLHSKIADEVIKNTNDCKGDWKPLVFIMTDGRSGDSVQKALNVIDVNSMGKVVVCATGKEPKLDVLRLITENVIQLTNMSSQTIMSFFIWISQSVSSNSKNLMESNCENIWMDELPPLPQEIKLIV